MCAYAVCIYSLNRLQTLLKAKLIAYKDYLWNSFSHCRSNQSFTHSLSWQHKEAAFSWWPICSDTPVFLLSSDCIMFSSSFWKVSLSFSVLQTKTWISGITFETHTDFCVPVSGTSGLWTSPFPALHPVTADGKSDRCRLPLHWVILQITHCRYTLP